MRACGQKLVKFCTHTDTHAAKLVVQGLVLVEAEARLGPGSDHHDIAIIGESS